MVEKVFGFVGLFLGFLALWSKRVPKRSGNPGGCMYKQEKSGALNMEKEEKHRISSAFIFQEKDKYSLLFPSF